MEGKVKLQEVLPADIEKRSFEIISQEMGDVKLDPLEEPIVKRVIHTSADFDYLENLVFSPGAVETAMEAILQGVTIVTDTNMAWSGINKRALERFGGKVCCFMADEDVREAAKKRRHHKSRGQYEKSGLPSWTADLRHWKRADSAGDPLRADSGGQTEPGVDHRCTGGICECCGVQRADSQDRRASYRSQRTKRRQQYCRCYL